MLDALDHAGVPWWREGGWGVDALVGRQARSHRDVDVDIDAVHEDIALGVLRDLGYEIETDWRPNRVELAAAGRGWVDLHPLLFDPKGDARQPDLDGGFYDFPKSFFVTGQLAGRAVGCFSIDAQRYFHAGYELRPIDLLDLAHLDQLPGASANRSADLPVGPLVGVVRPGLPRSA